jgi:hypothetical protein
MDVFPFVLSYTTNLFDRPTLMYLNIITLTSKGTRPQLLVPSASHRLCTHWLDNEVNHVSTADCLRWNKKKRRTNFVKGSRQLYTRLHHVWCSWSGYVRGHRNAVFPFVKCKAAAISRRRYLHERKKDQTKMNIFIMTRFGKRKKKICVPVGPSHGDCAFSPWTAQRFHRSRCCATDRGGTCRHTPQLPLRGRPVWS